MVIAAWRVRGSTKRDLFNWFDWFDLFDWFGCNSAVGLLYFNRSVLLLGSANQSIQRHQQIKPIKPIKPIKLF
jgi:hypothetical protein